jgi:FKBP-type peptidyl-prolyl cis-trans isomerase SlyD
MSRQIVQFETKSSYLRVAQDRVVQLEYALFDAATGEALEMRDDLLYLHGGYGSAFPKIEETLEGAGVGDRREVHLEAQDAFGPRDPSLEMRVPLEEIPPDGRRAGVELDAEGPDGRTLKLRVVRVTADEALLNGNHPFAGRALRFVLEVLDVRRATSEERARGYALRGGGPAGQA